MRQKYKNNCKYPYIILFLFKKYLFKHEAVTHIPFFNTYNHQYMTNVEAANSEALKTKNAYNGMLDSVPLVFSIPVYENMPAANCPVPQ